MSLSRLSTHYSHFCCIQKPPTHLGSPLTHGNWSYALEATAILATFGSSYWLNPGCGSSPLSSQRNPLTQRNCWCRDWESFYSSLYDKTASCYSTPFISVAYPYSMVLMICFGGLSYCNDAPPKEPLMICESLLISEHMSAVRPDLIGGLSSRWAAASGLWA